jgi:hypothetical protein
MVKHKFKTGDVIRIGLDWEFYTLVKPAGPRRGWYVRVYDYPEGSIYRFMAKTMRLATIVTNEQLIVE